LKLLTDCQDGFGSEVFGWNVVEANQDGIIREDNVHSPIDFIRRQ
jgi:hypothetical protein